ncbi:MAG: hypothetical protein R3D55_16485 [Chloroflexota bacterium]
MVAAGAGFEAKLFGQVGVAGFGEVAAVAKNDGGDDALAVIGSNDKLLGLGVLLDVYPVVGNLVLARTACCGGSRGTSKRRKR